MVITMAPAFYFDAFSSREPVPTPDQVRGRLSLENATGGYDRKARSRNRLSRTARPACPHHARVARHVAESARQGFRHFRTLYRAARERQGQRLDRAAAARVERDGRASG